MYIYIYIHLCIVYVCEIYVYIHIYIYMRKKCSPVLQDKLSLRGGLITLHHPRDILSATRAPPNVICVYSPVLSVAQPLALFACLGGYQGG